MITSPKGLFPRQLLLIGLLATSGCALSGPAPMGKITKKVVCAFPKEISFRNEKIKIVGIFSTWDVKSQVQMGRITKVQPLFGKKVGVAWIFIDNDSRMVDGWVASYKPKYPVLYYPKFKLCGNLVNRVPITVIVGESGRICYSYQGAVTSKVLFSQIKDALKSCK